LGDRFRSPVRSAALGRLSKPNGPTRGLDVAPNRMPMSIPLIANDLPWTFWMSFQEEEPGDEF